jgi:hypothetical protein
MITIYDAFINALLADATYALDDTTTNGLTGKELEKYLNTRMTPTLAKYIGDNFTVVTHIETPDAFDSGFDATVWRDSSGKTYVSMQGTTGLTDITADIDLTLSGAARAQLVDMVNWWIKNTTPAGQSAAQIEFLNGVFLSAPPAVGTGILSDVASVSVNGHSLGGASCHRIYSAVRRPMGC